MSIVRTVQSPPAGWYQEPSHGVGLRYWDGQKWTEHVYVSGQQYTSPMPVETTAKKKIYWSNLFRIRTWWFALSSAFLAVLLLAAMGLGPLTTPVFVLTFVGVGWYWLTKQMACHHCGTLLRVTRLTGGQEVCTKCNAPTDKALS